MADPLSESIEGLYVAFAAYQRPAKIEVCEHCYGSPTIPGPGAQGPLRVATAEELAGLAADILTTAGDLASFRHYLPRFFEIAVREGFGWPDMEVVFGKLSYGDSPWQSWPAGEQTALRRFFQALWAQVLESDDPEFISGVDPESVLCAISRTGEELSTYLDRWTSLNPASTRKLARLVEENYRAIQKGKLSNPFWADAHIGAQEVLDWLRSERLMAALLHKAEETEPGELADLVDRCFEDLANL